MGNRKEFDQIVAFVREANKISQELSIKGGVMQDPDQYQDDVEVRDIIENLVIKADINGLKDIRAMYLDFFSEIVEESSLDESVKKNINDRLLNVTEFSIRSMKTGILLRGIKIYESGQINNDHEFKDLDYYWNTLKDKGDPDQRMYTIEIMLASYEKAKRDN